MKLAQKLILPGENITINGPADFKSEFTDLGSIVSAAIPIILALAGFALFLYLVWGGFDYLTSMGDPKKAESGKTKITHALVGFFIIFAAYWIVQIIDKIFCLGVYSTCGSTPAP